MTSFRKPAEIARRLVIGKCMHGTRRSHMKKIGMNGITSISTEKKYIICVKKFLQWCSSNGYPTSKIRSELAQSFLLELSRRVKQKTLDGYRQALSLVLDLQISHAVSNVETILKPRAYSKEQISFLTKCTSDQLKLSIEIAAACGLRAHELDTISRPDEMAENEREWLQDRFQGLKNTCTFVVSGKGGLRRQIRIPSELTKSLEARRFAQPTIVTQRGIHYLKRYDLIGGQQFSQQFSRLSKTEFGWSNGAHGLRHFYAQERLQYLQTHGHTWNNALQIVSQELGHFSTTNTMAYLR